jgi:hypothetical protein
MTTATLPPSIAIIPARAAWRKTDDAINDICSFATYQ